MEPTENAADHVSRDLAALSDRTGDLNQPIVEQ
jgi:hypothetical protein